MRGELCLSLFWSSVTFPCVPLVFGRGASGGAGGSLEELEEENGRLRAVLERNLESCRALLSEVGIFGTRCHILASMCRVLLEMLRLFSLQDVFNRIQTEIESGNELDAGFVPT